jgi:predicted DNA-binding transcriptional regulator AlpA
MKRIASDGLPVKADLRIVLRPDARKLLGGISSATEYRLSQVDPDFPQRVEVSPGLTGYIAEELNTFIAKKIAQRDDGHRPSIVLAGERVGRSGRGGRPRSPRAPDPHDDSAE